MSSYPTEHRPEDEAVFYSFRCRSPQELLDALESFKHEDFKILWYEEAVIA